MSTFVYNQLKTRYILYYTILSADLSGFLEVPLTTIIIAGNIINVVVQGGRGGVGGGGGYELESVQTHTGGGGGGVK